MMVKKDNSVIAAKVPVWLLAAMAAAAMALASMAAGPVPVYGATLGISTETLPAGGLGLSYGAALVAGGGVSPYTWSATGLPPGLSLDASTGVINGRANVPGSFTVAATVRDGDGRSAAKTFTLSIAAATLTAAAAVDSGGVVNVGGVISSGGGQPVSVMITGPGGKPAYIANTVSAGDGNYNFSYDMSNSPPGIYHVTVGSPGIAKPVTTSFVKGEANETVNAAIDADRVVTVTGTIGTASGQGVSVMIVDPSGKVEYVNNTTTTDGGNYNFSYTMANAAEGMYKVLVGSPALTSPLTTSFVYGVAGTVTAGVSAKKQVTISGVIGPGAGQGVSVMIIDPSGKVEYVNNITTTDGGNYTFSYTMSDTAAGTYMVSVGSPLLSAYLSTSFVYMPESADLKNLEISSGKLYPSFTPKTFGYTDNVDNSVSNVTITPTALAPNAVIKVNGKVVPSGNTSGEIALASGGDTTITVGVTSPDGTAARTYTVTVARAGPPGGGGGVPEARTAAPTVGEAVYADDTSVSGTAADGAAVVLYDNGNRAGTATAGATGAWTVTGLTLKAGDSLTATAQVAGQLVSNASAAVQVQPPRTAPQITSPAGTSFTAGEAGSFTVVASGDPTPALTETGELPAGVSFKDNGNGTAALSGTPETVAGAVYQFAITAGNGVGSGAAQSFTLTVNQPATPTPYYAPAVAGPGGATFNCLCPYEPFTVTPAGNPAPALWVTGALPGGTAGNRPLAITPEKGVLPDAAGAFTMLVSNYRSI